MTCEKHASVDKAVERERDEAIDAIKEFVKEQSWAAPIWKEQPHIKRLFDIARRHQ